jgi:hypothetical protein
MRSYCPARSTALMPRPCTRNCRGFECKERETQRKGAIRSISLPVLTDVVRIANFNPDAPVHPSMQNDAWDDWKPIREFA